MSSENMHYSMKDQEEWDARDWEEYERDEMRNEAITAEEFAKNQSDWDEKFGMSCQLIFKALGEQQGTLDTNTFDFMFYATKMAVDVIANKQPCTLNHAYTILGYKMHKSCKNCGTELGRGAYHTTECGSISLKSSYVGNFCCFVCAKESVLNNTDPVPF